MRNHTHSIAVATPAVPGGNRRAPVVAIAGAAAGGIVVDRWLSECDLPIPPLAAGLPGWWLPALLLLSCWFVLFRQARHATASVLVLLLIATLAGAWHHWQWNLFANDDFGLSATEHNYPCCIEAIAVAAPQRTAAPPPSPYRAIPQTEKSQLVLQVARVRDGRHWSHASGHCELIVDGHLLDVRSGDRLLVFGQFRAPSPARNPGQFDYAKHLRADRQLCFVRCESPDCVTVLTRGSDSNPARWIDRVRAAWQQRLWATLGADRAPVATAILLGDRNAMPRETVDAYRVTGALHVLVVSGLHAGILIAGVLALLGMGFLPRRTALAGAMVMVALYAALTGAHPPVVRATILTELACLALWFHRNPFALNSLAIAALVVLVLNPADLFRTGPQLSFLCVATLMWFGSVRWFPPVTPLQTLIFNSRPWYQRAMAVGARRLGWTMAATLAVWVLSLPILTHQYHLVSPIAVLACVPVFFCLSLALTTGFTFLIGGWLIPALEPALGRLLSTSVDSLDNFVRASSDWPHTYFWTPGPHAWWVVGWYGLASVLLCSTGTRLGWRRTLQLLAMWTIVGAVPVAAQRLAPGRLQASFLDVGHGVCVVITTPEGTTLLYDAGSLGSPGFATETIASYLWSRGIRKIDGIVLSHPDVDHFNAVPGLVDRFRVGRVFASPHMFPREVHPSDNSAPAALWRVLAAHQIPIHVVQLGDRLALDSTTSASVLYPDWLGSFGSDNSNSLVVAVESGPHRILLPGDLEAPGIDDLLADEPYGCDVLLAPHHGSRRSDPPGFAAWSRPKCVVVSGVATADRMVKSSYRAQGAELLQTCDCGAVEVVFGPDTVQVERYRP